MLTIFCSWELKNSFLNGFFMDKIYLCEALMHVWVQQSAEAFKF
jgi:hypothetical protein